jgi:hypothetical protein
LEQALVAALVEMLVTTPKQALERAGKAEERAFALRLAQEERKNAVEDQAAKFAHERGLAELAGQQPLAVARAQAEAQRAASEAEYGRTRELAELTHQHKLAEQRDARSGPEQEGAALETAAKREQLEAIRRQPVSQDTKKMWEERVNESIKRARRANAIPFGRDYAGPQAEQAANEVGGMMEEVRGAHRGPEGERLARELGDVLTEHLYGLRPLGAPDRKRLAETILRHKQRQFGPEHAGVTMDDLTSWNPFHPGAVKGIAAFSQPWE